MQARNIFLIKNIGQLQVLIMGALALTALVLSLLWLLTAFNSWKGVMLERRVNQGQSISPDTLLSVWDQIKEVDKAFLPGTHLHLPGLAGQLIIMNQELPVETRAEVLLRSEESIINALTRDPAQTFSWARLAWFRHLEKGPSPEVVEALRMSIYTAPAKRSLLFWRIGMAGRSRMHWDQEFENLVRRQLIYGQRVSKTRLENVAGESGLDDLVRATLNLYPPDIKDNNYLPK